MNFIIFIFTKLINKFDTEQKSSKFLLEIMTLVSSTNDVVPDVAFILRGMSLVYIMDNRGPRTDTWGTPCFNVPQSEKNFELY